MNQHESWTDTISDLCWLISSESGGLVSVFAADIPLANWNVANWRLLIVASGRHLDAWSLEIGVRNLKLAILQNSGHYVATGEQGTSDIRTNWFGSSRVRALLGLLKFWHCLAFIKRIIKIIAIPSNGKLAILSNQKTNREGQAMAKQRVGSLRRAWNNNYRNGNENK